VSMSQVRRASMASSGKGTDLQAEMLVKRGIMATAVQNKERSAERELMEYLEEVSASYHVAQLLMPDLRCTVSRDD